MEASKLTDCRIDMGISGTDEGLGKVWRRRTRARGVLRVSAFIRFVEERQASAVDPTVLPMCREDGLCAPATEAEHGIVDRAG